MRNGSEHVPYLIKSAAHTLEVLDLLGERQEIRVKDVAEYLGIAASSAHRLLSTLQHYQYVTQDEQGSLYRPGAKMPKVHPEGLAVDELCRVSQPVMVALRDLVHESVSLSIRMGGEIQFVGGVDSTYTLRASPRVGSRIPAYATAGGKVQLAGLEPGEIEEMYSAKLRPLTQMTITDREELQAVLSEVKRSGFCVSREQSSKGISAVAVPLPDEEGQVLAGLAVIAPEQRLDHELVPWMVEHLRRATYQIRGELVELAKNSR